MTYEVVELEEKIVVGKSVVTTNVNGQSQADIGKMWNDFINGGIYESVNNKTTGKGIGLYTAYQGDETKPYTFMCCTQVANKEDNDALEIRTIPAGKYAKFIIKGNMVTAVGQAWMDIYTLDLDRRFDVDFELYHNDSEDMDDQTIDIYISIK